MAKKKSARAARSGRRSEAAKPAFWDRLERRRQHLLCIAFLFITAIAFFVPFHMAGDTFVGHDVIQWRAGAQSIIEDRDAYGEEPLWASNMFSGMPAYVISHVKMFPNLDNVVLPALRFMYPIAEYWILLAGVYVLFVLLGFRPLVAVFGAIVIGFTTYIPIIIGAGHNTKFWAYAYMPWILVGYAMITRRPDWRWIGLAIFVLAFVLHLRQSHPQVTYYYVYLLAAWWIFDLVTALRNKTVKQFGRGTALLAGASIIAVLAVVQPYWAMLEYSPHSIRGGSEVEATSGLSVDYAFVWSQGWGELLTLAVPNLYGGAEAYWGPKPVTSGPHYFGALALLFLVLGLFRGRHPLKWLFFGVGVVTMLFSLGRHFPALNETMFHLMPGFNKFRTPEMWLIVTVFCFTLVSLTGIEWLYDRIREAKPRLDLSPLYLPVGFVAGFAILMALGSTTMFTFERDGERSLIAQHIAAQANVPPDDARALQAADQYITEQLVPDRVEKAESDSQRFAIFVLLGAVLLVVAALGKIPVSYAVIGFIVLSAVDLLTVGSRYMGHQTFVPRGTDVVQVLENQRRPLDAFIEETVETEEGWPYRTFPLLDNPFNNAIPAYFYPSVGGYSGAKMGTYQDVIDHALFATPVGLNLAVLNMLNVRYVTHNQPLGMPGFEVAFEGERGVVMENTGALPKAFFVDSLAYAASPEEALSFISEVFDAASVAVVEAEGPFNVQPDTLATARVTTYRPRLIEIEVERATPGFLVLGEIFYPPGWSASINDAEVPIIKTNYILRGVEVPAGLHVIRFEFNPPSFMVGQPIAVGANIVMWLAILGLIGLVVVRRRRDEPEEVRADEVPVPAK